MDAASSDLIDVESLYISKPYGEPVLVTVENEELSKSGFHILEDSTEWLNCKLINDCQFLLKKRFPTFQGLIQWHTIEPSSFHSRIDILHKF